MTRNQYKKWFSKKLKQVRSQQYVTRKQLAENTGLTPDWISHFEAGRRLPDAYAMSKLQQALDYQF